MAGQTDTDPFIASLTVAEIRRGIHEKPAGKQREQLEAWFSGAEGPQALLPVASSLSMRSQAS